MIKLCAIIPTYNHVNAIGTVIAGLRSHGLPIFIIDDGSKEDIAAKLAKLNDPTNDVVVARLSQNSGKGAAVIRGFNLACDAGYTHALQIDADGQHDLNALSQIIKLSRDNPASLISGVPIYDSSIPLGRKIGRWITHVWVWIETLSTKIKDSMCGFRIYPLASTLLLINKEPIGSRMDFDIDIIVRMYWRGIDIINVPVKVIYPPENTSNFRVFKDNILISVMHTRLFFSMLYRLPTILAQRKSKQTTHWADLQEKGSYFGIKFCTAIYRLFGKKFCQMIMTPIVLYFYLVGGKQKIASEQYLQRVFGHKPTFAQGYIHFWNFSMRMLETFAAWNGDVDLGKFRILEPKTLLDIKNDPNGALIVVSHLGNAELAHFLLDKKTRNRLFILLHSQHAANYNRVIREFDEALDIKIIEVSDIGPETIINLKQHVENGAWIVIAGDRPALSNGHTSSIPFLGDNAAFAHGPWLLGALLECPVYLLFCIKINGYHELTMEYFSQQIILPRNTRDEAFRHYITSYVARLEYYVRKAPFQWFNFFNFWTQS